MDGAKVLTCFNRNYRTVILPINDIYSLNDNLNDKAFDKILSNSLKSKGMLNPLLVCTDEVFKVTDIRKFERRKVEENVEQKYRCLIGNNRYKFASDNGYTHIECVLVNSYDEVKRLHLETQIEPRKM